jgi:predicted  nucleic acid-binding Zn-ribbon protein
MSAMFPEEPTPGQTGVILQSIYDTLQDVKKNMATREFVDTKFGSFNDRVTRLEDDVKKLGEEQNKNTQELKDMITDRVNQVIADFDEEKSELNRRIDDIIGERSELAKHKRSRTVSITVAIIAASLSLIVSVVSAVIVNSLIP